VLVERTCVGLDVHARSVAAAAIDGVTGELCQARLTPSHDHIRSWIEQFDGPVAVAYEAGPTGFGLYRALNAVGVRCVVAAPSKLQRPPEDRVTTDAKDAVHLARLLRLGEITAVTVPTVDQEAARDLVRAREDCWGDVMRARHRLSRLLLRYGFVYSGGQAWTGVHDQWLRRQRFDHRATTMAFESGYEAVTAITARRGRLDKAIAELAAGSEFTPIVHRLGCLGGSRRSPRSLWPWRSATGTASPAPASPRSSASSRPSTPRAPRGYRARSPRPATSTSVACLSRRPGTTVPPTVQAKSCVTDGTWPTPPLELAVTPATGGCTSDGFSSTCAANDQSSPTSPSPANWPVGAGLWPSWASPTTDCFVAAGGGSSAWSDPRFSYEQPGPRPGHARL
jgi:Transposase